MSDKENAQQILVCLIFPYHVDNKWTFVKNFDLKQISSHCAPSKIKDLC